MDDRLMCDEAGELGSPGSFLGGHLAAFHGTSISAIPSIIRCPQQVKEKLECESAPRWRSLPNKMVQNNLRLAGTLNCGIAGPIRLLISPIRCGQRQGGIRWRNRHRTARVACVTAKASDSAGETSPRDVLREDADGEGELGAVGCAASVVEDACLMKVTISTQRTT